MFQIYTHPRIPTLKLRALTGKPPPDAFFGVPKTATEGGRENCGPPRFRALLQFLYAGDDILSAGTHPESAWTIPDPQWTHVACQISHAAWTRDIQIPCSCQALLVEPMKTSARRVLKLHTVLPTGSRVKFVWGNVWLMIGFGLAIDRPRSSKHVHIDMHSMHVLLEDTRSILDIILCFVICV